MLSVLILRSIYQVNLLLKVCQTVQLGVVRFTSSYEVSWSIGYTLISIIGAF